MDATVFVVQFPHPGAEHVLGDGSRMTWNTGRHGRKFLRSPGRSVDPDGRTSEADLAFWGEWEAPSRVVSRWPRAGQLPQELHVPVWERPATPSFRQNTDPWVFGKAFRYSNCRQLTYRQNPSALQALTPGSVIFFGSRLHGEFVLDTVFVVKPEYTDRSLRGRDAGLPESLAGVAAFAGRCRSEERSLRGAEGAVARVREACAGVLARGSDPGRCCERASGRERYRP